MSKDNLLEILQNNGDLNDVKPISIFEVKNMMCDFNKTFFTPKEEIQKQCECIQALLTHEKGCSVCANSEVRLYAEMGYVVPTTWCKISGEYVDYKCGKSCPSWKAKYPQYEKR